MENINNENTDDNNHDEDLNEAPQDHWEDDTQMQDEPEPSTFGGGPTAPPPPPFGGAEVEDRLVRDPHAFFGGVLSGIANRFGWETSLTRLAFVVLLIMSGGSAILAYILAWMIIPRARIWPPVVRKRTRSLSGRDLGLGLIGLALLAVIGVGAGEAAAILVPLVLVAGGVWLLIQKPREQVAVAGVDSSVDSSTFQFSGGVDQQASAPSAPWTAPQMPTIAPQPVEPRSRGRKFVVVGLIGAVLLVPMLIVGGIVAAVAFSDIDIEVSETFTPETIEEIPANLGGVDGEYILDLRNVDFSDVDASSPVEVAITQDVGRIEVRVGSDVNVEVDADVDLGDVRVFGESEDGISPEVSILDDDAQLVLDLDVDLGEIVVVRG